MTICAFLWTVFLHEVCGGLGRIQCERPFAGDPSRNRHKLHGKARGISSFLAITSVECAVLKGGCTPGRTGRDFFPKNAKAQNRKTGLQKTPIAFFSARWKC